MLKLVKILCKITTLHALTISPNSTQDQPKYHVSWRLRRIAIFLIQDRTIHPCQSSCRSSFDTKPLCYPSWIVCECPKILGFTHFEKRWLWSSLLLPLLSISLQPHFCSVSALHPLGCCILFITCVSQVLFCCSCSVLLVQCGASCSM